jgi:deoxyadenosine/deoxycytidine kinase
VLLARIRRRGREFERKFDPGYLEEVVKGYNDYFFHYSDSPLLVINTSDIDFVHDEADLHNLIDVIQKHRRGVHHYIPLGTRRG